MRSLALILLTCGSFMASNALPINDSVDSSSLQTGHPSDVNVQTTDSFPCMNLLLTAEAQSQRVTQSFEVVKYSRSGSPVGQQITPRALDHGGNVLQKRPSRAKTNRNDQIIVDDILEVDTAYYPNADYRPKFSTKIWDAVAALRDACKKNRIEHLFFGALALQSIYATLHSDTDFISEVLDGDHMIEIMLKVDNSNAFDVAVQTLMDTLKLTEKFVKGRLTVYWLEYEGVSISIVFRDPHDGSLEDPGVTIPPHPAWGLYFRDRAVEIQIPSRTDSFRIPSPVLLKNDLEYRSETPALQAVYAGTHIKRKEWNIKMKAVVEKYITTTRTKSTEHDS